MESFKTPIENWKIAGDVFMDLYKHHDVQPEKGRGVLVNTNEGEDRQDLYTVWEHGDMDLELEFMMAKESNSGIYFQGRYELQLLDSWGVKNSKFSDLGGIYEWWEDGKGVGGIAPRVNAARAPGLWQHLRVKFRAPRFNEQGEKIAHAKFEEVILNGVPIHEDVDLTHPTGGAISNEEVPVAPLRFQGDHGPVAIRNIKYKTYEQAPLRLDEISYRYYEGEFATIADFERKEPVTAGKTEDLSLEALAVSDKFALVYEGTLQIKKAGEYFFELRTDGGGRLSIDGNTIAENDVNTRRWDAGTEKVTLPEGKHTVELIYFRGARGGQPALSLMAEGPGLEMHALHSEFSFPAGHRPVPKIVGPGNDPLLMHGFMDMGDRVHTHSAAVGSPKGIHYAFDLNSGALLKLWKGAFLNVSPMWEGRGGGNLALAVSEATAIPLSGAPSLANLESEAGPWPDALLPGSDYTFKHYSYEEDGFVAFHYRLDGLDIEDRIVPANGGRELARTLMFHTETEHHDNRFFVRLAAGESISELPNGLYQVNDKTFYIRLNKENDAQARVRDTDKVHELLVPVSNEPESSLTYSLIW